MSISVDIPSLESGLSKKPQKPSKPNPAVKSSAVKNGQYAQKPKELSSAQDKQFVDLRIIGDAVAKYIVEMSKVKVTHNDIRILYLSGGADAICYCQLQYNFYDQKQRADLTPLYLYMGRDGKVMKIPFDKNTETFSLGTTGELVNTLNKDGYNFRPAIDLLVK